MEKPCTLIIAYEKGEPYNVKEIKEQLENGNTEQKIEALKKTLLLLLNGENLPQLLMIIIRFVLPSQDHTIKKLLLLFWEICDKTEADGSLLPQMILVCNYLRNDLNHPNEYIRGSTLRFLCKLKEVELLEPLLPSIRANLEHRHAYVRRNAVLAIYSIYKNFDYLIPDGPEIIFNFLVSEGDASCKRNAFIMLYNCAQEKAIEYLGTVLDQVSSLGEIIQLIIVELIRKVCRANPGERSKYIKAIFTLLNSTSSAVQYESAGTLVSLSSAPTAIRAAASTYISLLCKESDNNVKMIILDKLTDLKNNHQKVLQELLLDIMRALSSPNMDLRKKTLELALDLVSPRNIDEVIMVLKKEINKTQSKEEDKGGEYRQMLIQAIHCCAVKFPDVAHSVVHLLLDFLGDSNVGSAYDVILFVREVVETYPNLRESIVKKLIESYYQIKSSKVYRAALWITAEYCATLEDLELAFNAIKEALGEYPFAQEKIDPEQQQPAPKPTPAPTQTVTTRVLADGTYASQSALTDSVQISTTAAASSGPSLRSLLFAGDFFLASTLATTLAKLVFRYQTLTKDAVAANTLVADVLLILVSLLRLGESPQAATPIDSDSYDRIVQTIKLLANPDPATKDVYLKQCRDAFASLLKEQQKAQAAQTAKPKEVSVQADDLITIRQLRSKKHGGEGPDDDDDTDLTKVTGLSDKVDMSARLSKVFQLTGFSDPIYAEAFMNVHQYDIVLDVLVINQTGDTLQNVSLELATLGDLKLCERPQNYTLGPHDRRQIKANIKVSSTEAGIIFGNIVYDVAGVSASDKNCVILNDIHIDIMDYISPANCSDAQFRSMWAEFEWENKVAVNTNFTEVNEFLEHIIKSTNMRCLTPESALSGDCGFLASNLYAKSVFGEDALANISIEKQADGKIGGFIRIRSKTQGIALSLGDKITLKQKAAA